MVGLEEPRYRRAADLRELSPNFRFMNKHLLLATLVMLPLGSLAEPGWKEYVNGRFGFKISHPASLIASRDPENGDGRELHTKDKEFSVVAVGHFLNDSTLVSLWENALREYGASITYKKKAKDWYVVSGVKDGVEFYRKLHVKNGNWAELRFSYPHAQAKHYDPWVEKIVASFVPFLKGEFDRIEK
jgi:hypothetical protein